MGSPSIPAQPPAPDYGAANKEAIQTDISTLALRNRINQAAQLGQKITYQDPATGQDREADFTGLGAADAAARAAQIMSDSNAAIQRQQLDLRRELGTKTAEQTAAEIRAADPQGSALRDAVQYRANADLQLGSAGSPGSGGLGDVTDRISRLAANAPGADGRLGLLADQAAQRDGRIGSIYDQATRLPGEATDASTQALGLGLQRAMEEYKLGGKLDPDEKRDLLNEIRSGQAARGNYLGDAAAVEEQMQTGAAERARRQERLQSLLDIQGKVFGQNTQLRGETTQNAKDRLSAMSGIQGQDFSQNQARTGQLASIYGQDFGQNQQAYATGLGAAQNAYQAAQGNIGNDRAARQEGFGYDQQRMANASAAALGSPITNQFGNLSGAQNGTVGFTNVAYNQPGQLNQNAGAQGAQFAQGNFGTLANMWGKSADIAAQGNPWMSLLGNAAGAAAGAMI